MTRRKSYRLTAAVGAITLAGLGLLAVAQPASAAAATRYVAVNGDDGTLASPNDCTNQAKPCATIQHAVDVAAGGDTVSIAAGTYLESVTVPVSLTIVGAGSVGTGRTTITGTDMRPAVMVDGTVDGVPAPVEVRIADLELANSSDGQGDGLDVGADATVTVSDCVIKGNFDGIDIIGESGPGQLSVVDSVIDDNADSGVIIDSDGSTADITGSTLDHNTGAAVVGDTSDFTLNITGSTLSNTQPFSERTPAFGVGVVTFGGTTLIADSTITGNTGNGVVALFGTIDVRNSTVTDTQPSPATQSQSFLPDGALTGAPPLAAAQVKTARATFGGDAPQALPPGAPSISVTGTIDADNQVPDCFGSIADGGYNLSGDDVNSCAFSPDQHDIVTTDPKLAALADNGGPTLTQLPAADSPALDVIPTGSAGCTAGATDQRGVARPQPSGGLCDMGAVELAVAAPPTSSSAAPSSSSAASSSVVTSSVPASSSSLPSSSTPSESPNGTGTSLANTGARDVAALTGIGGGAVLLGVLALLGAAYLRRHRGRHSS